MLKDRITREGQPYVDEPVVVKPKRPDGFATQAAVAAAFGRDVSLPPIVVGHERVRLRWLKPDTKGNLKPAGRR